MSDHFALVEAHASSTGRALRDRLFAKTTPGFGGCVIWTGAVTDGGYGQISVKGKGQGIHRVAFTLLVGPIPEGMHLDHICHNRDTACVVGRACMHRRCINPHHLEPVTPKQNVLRGRGITALNILKTHCPQGHEYTPENMRPNPKSRSCRACDRKASRERQARIRAAAKTRLRAAVPATLGTDPHPGDSDPDPDEALRRARGGHGPQDDACPICGYWTCRCGTPAYPVALAATGGAR